MRAAMGAPIDLELRKGLRPLYEDEVFKDRPSTTVQPKWPAWYEAHERAPFRGCHFRRCEFGRELSDIQFIECTFEHCTFLSYVTSAEFYECEFQVCRFAYAAIVSTKLKFCTFFRCTFTGATILRCDLYRVFFGQGNSLQRAQLGWVSITRADLSGAGELRRDSFPPYATDGRLAPEAAQPKDAPVALHAVRMLREKADRPLIQENEAEYKLLLKQSKGALTRTARETLDLRQFEISEVHRALSALWMDAAAYDDAAWAYRRSRRWTRASFKPGRERAKADGDAPGEGDSPNGEGGGSEVTRGDARRVVRAGSAIGRRWRAARRFAAWLALVVADPLCGFGTQLTGVICAVGLWVLSSATVFWLAHALNQTAHSADQPADWPDSLRFSMGQLVTTPPGHLVTTAGGWDVAASIETFVGIGLLGLLGFVLGNRLRFS